MRDYCKAPCLVCGTPLGNCDPEGNQPGRGTEFTGGGCYGSSVTDHGDFTYAINICDDCLKKAIAKGCVLSLKQIRQVHKETHYDVLTES